MNSKPVDLADLAARDWRLEPFAVSRSVRIANKITGSPPIIGDADLLEHVLISLLYHCIKFLAPNGRSSLCVLDSTRTVSLFVRDEDPGFSDEALKYAFERFWKDDTARGRSGTELGIAIAKSAVERVGVSIVIRNTQQGGAEIETVFPLAAVCRL